MKNTLLALCIVLTGWCKAQSIVGVTMVPAAPTTTDSIHFYVEMMFPSGGCEGTATGGVSGSTVYASGMHCMGMLTVICTDYDTIHIGPQPAGNYQFVFILSAGSGGPPCSPPFVPNDYDTLDFTVSATTGLNEAKNVSLNVFPNPSSGNVTFTIEGAYPANTTIFMHDEAGRIVLSQQMNRTLDVANLPQGFYIASIPALGVRQRVQILK